MGEIINLKGHLLTIIPDTGMFRQAIVKFRLYVNQSANHASSARQWLGQEMVRNLKFSSEESGREWRTINSPVLYTEEQMRIQVNEAE